MIRYFFFSHQWGLLTDEGKKERQLWEPAVALLRLVEGKRAYGLEMMVERVLEMPDPVQAFYVAIVAISGGPAFRKAHSIYKLPLMEKYVRWFADDWGIKQYPVSELPCVLSPMTYSSCDLEFMLCVSLYGDDIMVAFRDAIRTNAYTRVVTFDGGACLDEYQTPLLMTETSLYYYHWQKMEGPGKMAFRDSKRMVPGAGAAYWRQVKEGLVLCVGRDAFNFGNALYVYTSRGASWVIQGAFYRTVGGIISWCPGSPPSCVLPAPDTLEPFVPATCRWDHFSYVDVNVMTSFITVHGSYMEAAQPYFVRLTLVDVQRDPPISYEDIPVRRNWRIHSKGENKVVEPSKLWPGVVASDRVIGRPSTNFLPPKYQYGSFNLDDEREQDYVFLNRMLTRHDFPQAICMSTLKHGESNVMTTPKWYGTRSLPRYFVTGDTRSYSVVGYFRGNNATMTPQQWSIMATGIKWGHQLPLTRVLPRTLLKDSRYYEKEADAGKNELREQHGQRPLLGRRTMQFNGFNVRITNHGEIEVRDQVRDHLRGPGKLIKKKIKAEVIFCYSRGHAYGGGHYDCESELPFISFDNGYCESLELNEDGRPHFLVGCDMEKIEIFPLPNQTELLNNFSWAPSCIRKWSDTFFFPEGVPFPPVDYVKVDVDFITSSDEESEHDSGGDDDSSSHEEQWIMDVTP
jgi:hypothetical protein